ncbi:hypothetical protein O53_756 [Microcystis aeruginosa TAIHU98]|nr:hypothetical protein O53_756 [Microcystis aeruginosa TAIHU98]
MYLRIHFTHQIQESLIPNRFLIISLTANQTLKTQLWTVSPCPSAPRFHKDTS